MNKIFVTGGTGFVGARVVRQLVEQGREVAVLMRASSNSRRIDDLLDRCTVIRGDLAQIETIRGALKHFSPEAVVHLAWDGVKGVDRNSAVQMDNIVASVNLYQLTEQIGCCNFVGLGSQAEYGPAVGRISESNATRPTTAYGAAKLATGLVLERTAAVTGRPFAWLRLFSSYGPDDDPSWLIPYMIRSLLAGEKPRLTKAEQIWDYIHVNDVAAGVIAALDAGACGFFNLGSGQERPLREIISLIRDMIDPSLTLGFGEVPYRPDQVMHLAADITALSSASGWSPAVSLKSGLSETVEWYKKEKSNEK
ncbi:NAD(P)-dependent oxidoreductase [Limnohabitans sp. G3-2]|uniref:NAD-dependent epimerase/dehydratase family protein n=1 Tax=Limnohabitans sp. G3-2 TaxID=1100711 RepID=UPI000C1E6D3F|nr:NAD(P)-dependent oxidoreductase [Limnohabitans sp. G3-2]PIT73919.1 CDP-abequose synthase [Limnohabitans sp. G3-2]